MLWKCNLDPRANDSTKNVYIWREILRRIYGPMQEKVRWHLRWNGEIYNSYKDLNIVDDIQWECHVTRVGNGTISTRGS
jgi:hypothetical protein